MQCNTDTSNTAPTLKSNEDAEHLYKIIELLLSKDDFMELYNVVDEEEYYIFCDEIYSCGDTQNIERLSDFIMELQEYYIL